MSKKLKVGVIGLGMGTNHLANYLKHRDAEVVAIADRRQDRRDSLPVTHPEFRGKVYCEGMEMIQKENLDIVSVAVPNNQHRTLTVAALESGANVLCEKPMALNAKEAQEMLDVAKRGGRKLGINFSYRFYPQSRAMKDMIEQGALGDIYYVRSDWFRRRGIPCLCNADFNTGTSSLQSSWFFDKEQSGGGPLIDLGVHRLDLALWLMGYPRPTWVMASTYAKFGPELARKRNLKYTVEDLACAMIKFDNGATLELLSSWAANIKENENQNIRLLGDKGGMYQYNINETYLYELEYYSEIAGHNFDSKMHSANSAPTAYALFVDAVRDDTPFLVQPEDGVIIMKILDAVFESARNGKPVELI